jgi:heme a synthase
LADFKFIYFWEWFHRLIARLIGVVYALPLAWFWAKGAIPAGFKPRLVGLLALGGLQGLFGWIMVQSGLVGDMVAVSHFKLSLHLLTALLLLALLVWTARDMRKPRAQSGRPACPLHGIFRRSSLGAIYPTAARRVGGRAARWPCCL